MSVTFLRRVCVFCFLSDALTFCHVRLHVDSTAELAWCCPLGSTYFGAISMRLLLKVDQHPRDEENKTHFVRQVAFDVELPGIRDGLIGLLAKLELFV